MLEFFGAERMLVYGVSNVPPIQRAAGVSARFVLLGSILVERSRSRQIAFTDPGRVVSV
jgi:hypothetical protein